MNRPPLIRTDHSNTFAHNTMKSRVPTMLRDLLRSNPDYPASIRAAVERHIDQLEQDAIIPLIDLPAPDYSQWQQIWLAHRGETWLNSAWFYAEIYNYRLLMQAVRWFEFGRDPFAPHKHEEISGASLWQTLERSLDLQRQPIEERLIRMLHYDLWGNRIDLSHPSHMHSSAVADDDLLVDDSSAVVNHLLTLNERNRTVHFIADNAGTELALDLALADTLLRGIADQVIFHLKQHPTFVSDAIPADVLIFLTRLERREGEFRTLGERLQAALDAGRLRLIPDLYWNRALPLWELPPHLVQTFQSAGLVISKGDLNYRRMIGDMLWHAATPFTEVLSYFKPPLVALRTLKSDGVIGLPKESLPALDATDPQWRVNGKRGLIQAANLRR